MTNHPSGTVRSSFHSASQSDHRKSWSSLEIFLRREKSCNKTPELSTLMTNHPSGTVRSSSHSTSQSGHCRSDPSVPQHQLLLKLLHPLQASHLLQHAQKLQQNPLQHLLNIESFFISLIRLWIHSVQRSSWQTSPLVEWGHPPTRPNKTGHCRPDQNLAF